MFELSVEKPPKDQHFSSQITSKMFQMYYYVIFTTLYEFMTFLLEFK